MTSCTNCGTGTPTGARFCKTCGTPVKALAPAVAAAGCSGCGAELIARRKVLQEMRDAAVDCGIGTCGRCFTAFDCASARGRGTRRGSGRACASGGSPSPRRNARCSPTASSGTGRNHRRPEG
ncbi:double zinc ribbon domain-containing protein [Cupriavidus basilensis]